MTPNLEGKPAEIESRSGKRAGSVVALSASIRSERDDDATAGGVDDVAVSDDRIRLPFRQHDDVRPVERGEIDRQLSRHG